MRYASFLAGGSPVEASITLSDSANSGSATVDGFGGGVCGGKLEGGPLNGYGPAWLEGLVGGTLGAGRGLSTLTLLGAGVWLKALSNFITPP
jgi:hypothetical protein